MLFATSAGEAITCTIVILALGVISFIKLFGRFDTEGKIHATAREGLIAWLNRKFGK